MATINKITEMIASIKTIYPYYAKDTDVPTLVKTWAVLLKDFPDDAVEVAFFKCLQTCKTPPTPADVIEKLNALLNTNEATEEELWDTFRKTLQKIEREVSCFHYNFIFPGETLSQGAKARKNVEEMWNRLPEQLKAYVGSKSELIHIAKTYTDEDLKFERNRFFKVMPTIKERKAFSDLVIAIEESKQQRIEGA